MTLRRQKSKHSDPTSDPNHHNNDDYGAALIESQRPVASGRRQPSRVSSTPHRRRGPAPDPKPPLRRCIEPARAPTRSPTQAVCPQPPRPRASPVHRRRSPRDPRVPADFGPWVSPDSSSISAYAGLCRLRSCLPGGRLGGFTWFSPRFPRGATPDRA